MRKKYWGLVNYSSFIPLLKEDRFRPIIQLDKSVCGNSFIKKNKINIKKIFSTCATVLFSEKNEKTRLLGFEMEGSVYNVSILDVQIENLIKSLDNIAKGCSFIRIDACKIIISQFINDYLKNNVNVAEKFIQVDLLLNADFNIASDLCRAIKSAGFNAYIVGQDGQKIDEEGNLFLEETKENLEQIKKDSSFFVLEESANLAFITAIHTMKQRGFASVLLTGASGWGKTSSAKKLASYLGYQFHKVDCGAISEPTEIVNIRSFGDGRTYFEKTRFAKLLEEGNAVILLDEANRMYPNVANALLPVLDGTGELVVATETYRRSKNIIFIATMNKGSSYHGTFDSDAAFLNRFGISAQLGNMDISQETNIVYHHNPTISMKESSKIVSLLRELRKTLPNSQLDFSPRTAENLASAISSGLSFYLAFKVVLHSLCTNEEWKVIADILGTNGYGDQGEKPKLLF